LARGRHTGASGKFCVRGFGFIELLRRTVVGVEFAVKVGEEEMLKLGFISPTLASCFDARIRVCLLPRI